MKTQPRLSIRVAQTFWSRLRGLLFRPALIGNQALYLAPCSSVHTFFMTYNIDVVFVDRNGCVMKVVMRLRPWRIAWCRGAHAALELRAGRAWWYWPGQQLFPELNRVVRAA